MPTCVRRRHPNRPLATKLAVATCSSSQCQPKVAAMRSSLRQVKSIDQRIGRSKLFEPPGVGCRGQPTQHRFTGVAQVHR